MHPGNNFQWNQYKIQIYIDWWKKIKYMIEVKHSLKNKPTLNLMYYHEHLPNPVS